MAHCYVIAGGPSLRDFPFDDLPDGFRIGANLSGWLAKCDALVTLDKAMHRRHEAELRDFKGQVYVGLRDDQIHTRLPNVNYWTFEGGDGFSKTPGFLSGSNSGFAALNLAYLLGFTDIALLGFDFQWVGSQHHYRDDYPTPGRRYDGMLRTWARAFDPVASFLREQGVRVTNFVGPTGSQVTAFPTAPHSQLF